jgi:hypothetical protein
MSIFEILWVKAFVLGRLGLHHAFWRWTSILRKVESEDTNKHVSFRHMGLTLLSLSISSCSSMAAITAFLLRAKSCEKSE